MLEKLKRFFRGKEKSVKAVLVEDFPIISSEGKPRIVVYEYYQQMRELYAKYLRGYSYFITGKKEEFLQEIEHCDAVIIDVCQGFQLARKSKAENNLPVICCTAFGSLEFFEEFKNSKADAFLIKPISQEELIGCLNRVIVKNIPEPAKEEKKSVRRGRKPLTFVDIAERNFNEFKESGLSKAAFARDKKTSLSSLKNEFKIVVLPESAKKVIKENIDCFKKSFFEHIAKLKNEQSIIDICNEISERTEKGNYYDLVKVKERANEYLKLEKE